MSIAEPLPLRPKPGPSTLEELVHELGDIPLSRILVDPPPGMATEEDLLHCIDVANLGCELVDGILVVKTMGMAESVIASILIQWINNYLDTHPIGACAGEAGICKLLPGLVRAPDVSFISRAQLTLDKQRDFTFALCAPELCVEVWSKSNTRRELDRKIREYFQYGARLVWEIFPQTRTAIIYHSPADSKPVNTTDVMDGEDVLPGFRFTLADLFAAADRRLEGIPIDDNNSAEPPE